MGKLVYSQSHKLESVYAIIFISGCMIWCVYVDVMCVHCVLASQEQRIADDGRKLKHVCPFVVVAV